MKISIFGGSSPRPGSVSYQDAFLLGRNLARSGHSVITGGYIGTMEAVSKGAFDSGGHVIGVTCQEIENWRSIKPNPYISEEIKCTTLLERVQNLIYLCDAALALPGGPGTLAEISLMWNLLIIEAIPPKPLILIGNEWAKVVESLFSSMIEYIPDNQRKFIQISHDSIHACNLIIEFKSQVS